MMGTFGLATFGYSTFAGPRGENYVLPTTLDKTVSNDNTIYKTISFDLRIGVP